MMVVAFMSFWVGAFVGILAVAFVFGATAKEKEQEIYKKGFNAGYQSRWGDDGKEKIWQD